MMRAGGRTGRGRGRMSVRADHGGKILVSMEFKALLARSIYGITPLIIIHAYNLLP